jgi:hypothetical protein
MADDGWVGLWGNGVSACQGGIGSGSGDEVFVDVWGTGRELIDAGGEHGTNIWMAWLVGKLKMSADWTTMAAWTAAFPILSCCLAMGIPHLSASMIIASAAAFACSCIALTTVCSRTGVDTHWGYSM